MEQIKKLSDFEWRLLWMAIRYAASRQTIAASTLPNDIMVEWYHRLSNTHKKILVEELDQIDKDLSINNIPALSDKQINRPTWVKFMKCLDETSHYQVELLDNTIVVVFEANGFIFPLARYIENPWQDIIITKDNIKRKIYVSKIN